MKGAPVPGACVRVTPAQLAAFPWHELPASLLAARPPLEELVGLVAPGPEGPLGMVLLEPHPQLAQGTLHTLFVRPQARGRGWGGRLLEAAEAEAASMGLSLLTLSSLYGPEHLPLEHLLRSGGYEVQDAGMLAQEALVESLRACPWLHTPPTLGPDLALFGWGELTANRRQELMDQVGRETWCPPELAPEPQLPWDPQLSVGLRRGPEIVGWLLVQEPVPGYVIAARGVVRPELEARGRLVSLMGAMVARLAERAITTCAWVVVPDRTPRMEAFARRRLGPWTCHTTQVRYAEKRLAGLPPAPR